jgi:hypothetical protein
MAVRFGADDIFSAKTQAGALAGLLRGLPTGYAG